LSLWEALLLGLIQGLTEFLPVSSSGHLVIFQSILGVKEPGVTLEVMLHFGTLISVLTVFRKDFLALFSFFKDKRQGHYLLLLLTGALVTGLLGLWSKDYVELAFKSTLLVGMMLLLTGFILILLIYLPVGTKKIEQMQLKDAVLIGLMQSLAIIPGISRSGATIVGALWRGLDRETAVRYSFMLAVPIIFGATLFEAKNLFAASFDTRLLVYYMVGALTAFSSGLVAIRTFISLLAREKMHYFAFYCWALGLLVIFFSWKGL
jgi:undecaprenyl-diphosphatase